MEQLQNLTGLITSEYIQNLQTILVIILLLLIIYYLINIGNRYIERSSRIHIDIKLIVKIVGIIIIFFILKYIFKKFPIIGSTLTALIISIILAYVINPLINFFQTKGIPRAAGVLIVYVGFVLVLAILMIVVVPKTLEEIRNLFRDLPSLVDQSVEWFTAADNELSEVLNIDFSKLIRAIEAQITNYIDDLENIVTNQMGSIASGMYSLVSKLVSFVLVLIFTFYFSVEKDRFKIKVYKKLPKKYKADILYLGHEIHEVLMSFIRGKLLLAFFVGLGTMIMLLILRVDFAIVIGLITMIADIIPYIGPFLGFLPAFIFAFLDSPLKGFWVGILFVFLQWAENNILAPKILGSRTGLHPVIVLVCIIVGGGMFGVVGMIFSVPVFSIGVVIKDFIVMKLAERREIDTEYKKTRWS